MRREGFDDHVQAEDLCLELRRFISGEDRSQLAAGRIEVLVSRLAEADARFDEFVTVLASYRPGTRALNPAAFKHLYDENDLLRWCEWVMQTLCSSGK